MGIVKDIIYKTDPITKTFLNHKRTIYPYYHTINNEDLPHVSKLFKYKNEKQFESDLDFLISKYKILDPGDLIDCINNNKNIPSNSFVLSFDDGLAELYDVIVPTLNKKGIPSILYINNRYIDNNELFYKHNISLLLNTLPSSSSDVINTISEILDVDNDLKNISSKISNLDFRTIDIINKLNDILGIDTVSYLKENKPYLSLPQLTEIKDQGHFIGGHTESHYPLEKLSLDDQITEVVNSIEWVKEKLDLDYELFAFPFSDSSATMSLINRLFEIYPKLICMGNSGMRKDISHRIIQRISLEKPVLPADQLVRSNLVYRYFNILTGKGSIARK